MAEDDSKGTGGVGKPAGSARNGTGTKARSGAGAGTVKGGGILPDGFRFGAAVAHFQVEGGFNGPGEPANNWLWWEMEGHKGPDRRTEISGNAVDFWNGYEEQLDLAAAMGCNAFRFGISWARVEPREGEIDSTALDRYVEIVKACGDRGMKPLVTLHHFTHPAWLGDDFWLSPDSPRRFASWVELAVGRLKDHVSDWVTINEINVVGMGSYMLGGMPPGRFMAMADVATCTDHMIAAHVGAYEVIHRLQPRANVTTNNTSMSIYELDKFIIDLIAARHYGVDREDVDGWIRERRREWYAALPKPSAGESAVRRLSASLAPIGRSGPRFAVSAVPGLPGIKGLPGPFSERALPGRPRHSEMALDAIYASPHPLTLDFVGIDYYDPVATHHVVMPGRNTSGSRWWSPGRPLWEDKVNPAGLVTYIRANLLPDRPLWIVENGLCNRVEGGRSYPRPDGWTRPEYIRANLAALVEAVDGGMPVGGYFHWSLIDNYEWGSYQPRFGIHGVERERGTKILATDSMGHDSAGAYRNLIKGLLAGDRSVLTV